MSLATYPLPPLPPVGATSQSSCVLNTADLTILNKVGEGAFGKVRPC